MDNMTQKTVRLKPLVKQPMVGDNSTESQSVKKVSTNSGAFQKVGTQTGRISSIATNTSRVVRINSAVKSSQTAVGSSTTMMDFKTSELQMAIPNQPNTTRPAAAPKSVLNSLNLKPKVAEASVVENAPADTETQTAAIPKIPAPIKPNITLSATPAPSAAPVIPVTPAPAPAPTPAAADAASETQTAAVEKPVAVKPVINLNSKPVIAPAQTDVAAKPGIPSAPITAIARESDDATVKLKRPEKIGTSQVNSVIPNITTAPKISVPTPAISANAVKPSQAPTVKLAAPSTPVAAPTVPETPEVADAKPKLGLKKAEEPAPEPPKSEIKEAEAPAAEPTAAEPKKKKKSVAAAAAAGAVANKKKSAKNTKTAGSEMHGFHFSVAFIAAIALIIAATFCWVQYLNIYQFKVFGKYIQIPFMEQVGK